MDGSPSSLEAGADMFPPETMSRERAITLENILEGFFTCDAQWRLVYVNATAERLLGIRREEVLGKSLWEGIPLPLGTEPEREYRRAAAGEVRDFEHFYAPWGRWFLHRCCPRQGGGVAVSFQDITERKRTEEALIDERNLLAAVMNGNPKVHLAYLDCDFNFVRVNQAYAAACGYVPEEMVGKNQFALYPCAENEAIFKQVRDTGQPVEIHDKPFAFPHQARRGVSWWHWALAPVKDLNNEVRGLVFSLVETTDRKNAEDALHRLKEESELQFAQRTAELEHTVASLKAGEQRYRAVVEDQTEVISRYKPFDHTFTFVNEVYCRFFGKKQEELLGRSWQPVAVAEDIPMIEAELRHISPTHPVVTIENRVYDGSGGVRWMQFVNRGLFDNQGRLLEIQSVGRDITALKETEERLARLHRQLQVILDSAPIGISVTRQRKFVSVNRRVEKMFGYSRAELEGRSTAMLYPSRQAFEQLSRAAEPSFQQHGEYESTLQMVHRDGSLLWVHYIGKVMEGDDSAQETISILEDVTRPYNLETRLRQSEEKYRALVETTSDCIWEMDDQGRFTFLSPKFKEMTGFAIADFLGKTLVELFSSESISAALSSRQPVSSLEVSFTHREGGQRYAEVGCVPVFNAAGEFQGMRGITRDITKRRLLMDALRESEEKYRRIFENELMAIFVFDFESNRFIDVNEAFVRLYGYSQEEIFSGMSLVDFSAEPALTTEAAAQAMKTGTLFVPLRYHRKKDGTIFPNEIVGWPATVGGKRVFFGLVHDITQRKQIEHEREQYVRLFDNALDVMCIIDASGCFHKVNPALLELLGRGQEEAIGRSFFDFVHPDDVDNTLANFNQLEEGSILKFVNRYLHKGGDVHWLSWQAFYSGAEDLLYATARDITERIRTEEQLRLAEAYSRSLIEVNLDPMVVIDPFGRISDVNAASTRVTGFSRQEMIGTDFSTYFTHPSNARAGYLEVFKKGEVRDYPLEIRHRNGHVTPVLYNAAVFLDSHRKGVCVFAAARDITKQKQLEEQLVAFNSQLEQRIEQRTQELQETHKKYLHAEKLSAIGKLSASIAHEFNNPLQAILTILKGLRKRVRLEEEDQNLLDAAIVEGDRIKELIRSLQDFNRPSSQKKVFMDLHACLNSLLLLYKNDFIKRRIALVVDFAEDLPQILAVPDQIKQVFLNLLANAADACVHPNSVITVITRREGENVIVVVRDTGIGIEHNTMDMIFQPFFTTKGEAQGTGLGLSVSYGIVKSHGGEILVESRAGAGTTFAVILPIKGGGDAGQSTTDPEMAPGDGEKGGCCR